MRIDPDVTLRDLSSQIEQTFNLAVQKAISLKNTWDPGEGTPVFTAGGQYTTRGWTEWTQGFQFGCAILAFEATGEEDLLEIGRSETVSRMAKT